VPTTRRFMDLYVGENEWLAEPPNDETQEDWERAWEEINDKCPHQIEFVEGIYSNQEYGNKPEWVDLTINDEGVLNFKMARGIINSINATAITFTDARYFNVAVSKDFHQDFSKLILQQGSAYLVVSHKDGLEEIEVDISPFFNHAIGE